MKSELEKRGMENSYNAKRFKKNEERLLPFETIKAAMEGDVDKTLPRNRMKEIAL